MKIPGLAGPVKVNRVKNCSHNGRPLLGKACGPTRTVELKKGMSSDMEEIVLAHEWVHFLMFDGGCQDIPDKIQERICDLVSTGMANAGLKLPRKK